MAVITQLGPARINAIASAQPNTFDSFLTPLLAETVDMELILAQTGTLPYEVIQSVLPVASTASDVAVGFDADAFTRENKYDKRNYDCVRRAERRGYSSHLTNESLYSYVKKSLIPNITRDLTWAIDSLLFEIMSGAGAALDSRDITSVAASTAWQTGAAYTGSPLSDLTDAKNKTNGDVVYLSESVYQLLARHPEVNDSNTGSNGGTSWLPRQAMADKLASILGVNEVIIGGRIYQNGTEVAAVNLAIASTANIAYVGRKANIAYIPFSGEKPSFREYLDDPKSKVYLQGEHVADLISVDPALSRTITGLTA